jgi:hypothetical protein
LLLPGGGGGGGGAYGAPCAAAPPAMYGEVLAPGMAMLLGMRCEEGAAMAER